MHKYIVAERNTFPMKYIYNFTEVQNTDSCFQFKCGSQNVRIDFLSEDIFRVAMYKDGERLLPTWAVAPGDTIMPKEGRERLSLEGFSSYAPSVHRNEEEYPGSSNIRFSLPLADFAVNLENYSVSLISSKGILFEDRPYSAYNLNGEHGDQTVHFLKSEKSEEIYGLGEKSGNVNKQFGHYMLSARDSMGYDGEFTDPLYKHTPFYICRNTSGCYGIYYDTHAQGSMDFAREKDNYYGDFKSFKCDDNALVYYVFLGDISTIAKHFNWLSGRAAFPPMWTLDYTGSTMAYTEAENADERLREFIDKCNEHELVCSGFYMSSGYTSINGKRYVFNWNYDKIPEPQDLVTYYKDNGVHFIPNIKPAFLNDHPMYDYISEHGWFLKDKDGSSALMPFWGGYGSYLDFTNPEAFEFWVSQVKDKLLKYGIDATWNDNNEYYIPDRDMMAYGFGNPIPAYRICHVFPILMVMASYKAQCEVYGNVRQMLSTRSGGVGLQRLAQTWTGDNTTSFHDLYYNHKMAMGLSMSGIPVFGHDIGGFAGPEPSPELFARWLQYGVLLPRFTVHSWNEGGNATELWMYPEMDGLVKKLFALRKRLKPYMYDLLYRVHKDYEMFLRPVFTDYPDFDPESEQFLLGHDVMAGVVFGEDTDEVYMQLPGCGWYKGSAYYEPGTYVFPLSVNDEPVLLHKEGTVFPEDIAAYNTNGEAVKAYTIYATKEGTFEYDSYDDDGISQADTEGVSKHTTIEVVCDELAVTVKVISDNPGTTKIRLIDYLNRPLIH